MAVLEPGKNWVRQPPEDAITDYHYFVYQQGMTFEVFVREFAEWYAQKRPAAVMVGIRADESYNRFLAIASARKRRFLTINPGRPSHRAGAHSTSTLCTTGKPPTSGHWFAKSKCCYNPLYDLMYRQGCRRVICASANRLARNSVRACLSCH